MDAVAKENRELRALALRLADRLEDAAYALFDAGMDGVGTSYDRAQVALRDPALAGLRDERRVGTAP